MPRCSWKFRDYSFAIPRRGRLAYPLLLPTKEEEEEEVAVVVAAAPAVGGLAKDTTNTYIIDGMAEMSPEEYRAKLQETISARQRKRRSTSLEGNRGIIGNASSQGYLDTLSGITGKNNGSPGNKKG
mmetsp:Transcript_31114/g.59113  ORF Transcript_31114/g.59113 Transcript_31114/m.59113 type:complete len:127 (+) Transcript_31114:424-804(+)